jgi:quinol-cytochrome oxidoreductase complex cytochrome b subunit
MGQETLRDITGSIIRNGWPTSVRGRSLAIMNSVFLHLHPIRTRPDAIKMTYTFGLGGLSFFLFLLLTLTGVLLMFYYIPAVPTAYQTIKDIQEIQPFGYLLPWDQLAIWAITVGTNMVGSTPFLGETIRFLLVGDYTVSQNALLRFYTLHVIGLPLLLSVFLAVHFWRIRKDGFSRGLTFTTRITVAGENLSAGARSAGRARE